jgi:hypothetical protein
MWRAAMADETADAYGLASAAPPAHARAISVEPVPGRSPRSLEAGTVDRILGGAGAAQAHARPADERLQGHQVASSSTSSAPTRPGGMAHALRLASEIAPVQLGTERDALIKPADASGTPSAVKAGEDERLQRLLQEHAAKTRSALEALRVLTGNAQSLEHAVLSIRLR